MAIGSSIFLMAVGAILRFAVYYHVHGASIGIIGVILMIAGALGLILGFTVWGPMSARGRTERTTSARTTTDGLGDTNRTVVREERTHTDVLP
ncbi:MAG TPA: DUF6458 family protein [Acidimicrobiales bacterium]|nr:DUF6458 family protein [Acidimicrobiales bacterium]